MTAVRMEMAKTNVIVVRWVATDTAQAVVAIGINM